jgi:predicted hotdog family 3-hydroxylacyl-ACP dehydratase
VSAVDAWPIDQLLPHSGAMILLDAVHAYDGERIACTRRIRPGDMFQLADGTLPAWAGIELMAQTVAAWAGCQARIEQRAVRLGFLLGTRHYRCNVASFPAGSDLLITSERGFHDASGMGIFACRIEAAGILAEARLTVFSPPDATAFFADSVNDGTAKESSA